MSKDHLQLIELENSSGARMSIINYGARIISLLVPDKHGKLDDVVLGFKHSSDYLEHGSYYGATIGRYANRIAGGKFSLNGKEYQLTVNNADNALHGGHVGFHEAFWGILPINKNSVLLTYRSKEGEEGYPGNLDVTLTYTLNDNNELCIDYEATTDQDTVINLTHHSFFNLAGINAENILDHELMINAKAFTPVNSNLLPTGELRKVNETPFDFTTPKRIGDRIDQTDEQLKFGNGYDHNWVLSKNGNEFLFAAKVLEPLSGRIMEVWTTEPGLQFYTGNFIDGKDVGKGIKPYGFRAAFCLEAQHFPDSPNHTHFPSTVLKPTQTYRQKTVYKFGIFQ